MADYLEKINDGLIIETPKLLLPWNLQKNDVIENIGCFNVVNEDYYTLKIVLTGISFINCAGLHFKGERLSKIDLFNNEKYCSESEITNMFNSHQFMLENAFGKSSRNMLLEKFKGVNKEYKWKFRYVTIIHKLWNRFGMEEELTIYINSCKLGRT